MGQFDFPAEDWARISDKAQDLIKHLLVKDAKQRYTADDVLKHPWLNEDAPKTPLQTPDVLLRYVTTFHFPYLHRTQFTYVMFSLTSSRIILI